MRTYKKYILGAAVLSVAALTGCKDKMRELNTDQDLISDALPEYQFLGATRNWGWFGRGWMTSRGGNIGAAMQLDNAYWGTNPYVDPTDWSGGNMSFLDNTYSRYYSSVKNLDYLVQYIDQQLTTADQMRYQDIRAIARLLQWHEAWTIFTNYGAMVFNDAFKVRQGVEFPKYDIYTKESGLYKVLDDSVKLCIEQLNSPMRDDAVALGAYDGFYGASYVTNETGGSKWTVVTAAKERERWLKFAITLRMKMAFAMRNVDPEYYQSVVSEVRTMAAENANVLMSEVQDGCQYVLPDDDYNRDDGNQFSFWYFMPVSYVNSMKIVNDPRLPLVVRPSDLDTSLSVGYKFIATYFHDTLEYQKVYDNEAKTWVKREWGNSLQDVYNGMTMNPANYTKQTSLPGTLFNTDGWSFVIRHPDWQNPNEKDISSEEKTARENANAKLTTIKRVNYFTGVEEEAKYNGGDAFVNGVRSIYLTVVGGIQNRNYVFNGGNSPSWSGGTLDYNNNQPAASNIKMVIKVLPYAEHCFLMALICNYDGGTIGDKSAEDWYLEGIRASMQEITEDSERVYVQICVNNSFPLIAGVNGTSDEDKHLYKINYKGADFDNYVAQPQIALTGSQDEKTNKIMIQMWLSLWQKPENTWFYYRATGYPHTVNYPWEVEAEGMPTTMGFEQPYHSTGVPMVFPRSVRTPTPQVENMQSWYEMQAAMEAQPGYAPHGWTDYSGRVFWDVVEPAGLAN
ncbi:MAG: SusD/RagB family nutrient-binding outer membrane lipoprotein [Rikenella sp.]|nr:SusD/RagB family nutrient-binding outer membrane lipoprotein [Rikenella sp.]